MSIFVVGDLRTSILASIQVLKTARWQAPPLKGSPMTPSNTAPQALPQLAPGVTVPVLRRVWFATPAESRRQASTLLESCVRVIRPNAGNVPTWPRLRDLTLAEVEAAIGAVTPRYVVRYFDPKASRRGHGVQVATFVEYADAEAFAAGKTLYAEPARVQPIAGGSR